MSETAKQEHGLFGKFYVRRADGRDAPGGDKADARYFVLDYVHDPLARTALRTYALLARREGADSLADDLLAEYHRYEEADHAR